MQPNASTLIRPASDSEATPPEDAKLSLNATTFVLPILCFVLLFVYSRQLKARDRRKGCPPLVPGLPFLGSAVQFQSRAVDFLHDCRRRFGDLFTLHLPFNRLHFLMDIHSLDLFTKHRHFDFDPIQAMVNRNVFNMRLPNARQLIREVAAHTKRSQMAEVVDRYALYIQESFSKLADTPVAQRMPLHELLVATQFRAIFNTTFGRSDEGAFTAQAVASGLDRFHRAFNFLWLGFPSWLFPGPHQALKEMVAAHPEPEDLMARPDASAYVRSAVEKLTAHGGSRDVIVGHSLVFTHINYNTVKVTYWALAHLASHGPALEALRDEADRLVEAGADGDDEADVQLADLLALPVLDSVVKETFRMSSGVLMVREVTETVKFQPRQGPAYVLNKGDKVAMYPPAIHMDPEIFDSPAEFRFDRFIGEEFFKDGLRVAKPILAYGSLCPGQQMSIAQFKFFLLSFVHSFDFRFDEGVPVYNRNCYGHEILPPREDKLISFSPRPSRRQLVLRFS